MNTSSSPGPAIDIAEAPRHLRFPALKLLCRCDPQPAESASRLRSLLDNGSLPPANLRLARRGDRMVGAALFQILPGRVAVMWAPHIIDGEPESTADALIHDIRRCTDGQIDMLQCPISALDVDAPRRLQRAGLERLAGLAYLVATEESFPAGPPTTPLSFVPCADDQDLTSTFADVIQQTYQRTLDCPKLNGLRTMEDTLASYRATGVYRSDWWFRVSLGQHTIGCVLLADHPDQGQIELLYMGLAPRFRGQGHSHHVMHFVLWHAGRHRRRQVVLAVDEANAPALAAYRRAGFRRWDHREIWYEVRG